VLRASIRARRKAALIGLQTQVRGKAPRRILRLPTAKPCATQGAQVVTLTHPTIQ